MCVARSCRCGLDTDGDGVVTHGESAGGKHFLATAVGSGSPDAGQTAPQKWASRVPWRLFGDTSPAARQELM